MKKTFILEGGIKKYIGSVERRPETYEQIKDKILQIEITEEQCQMIEHYGCEYFFDEQDLFVVVPNQLRNNRGKKIEIDYKAYFSAKLKQKSLNEEIINQGIQEEQAFLSEFEQLVS